MALWGNNDAKFAGGTISLNYSTFVVTGSGTSFGQVGAAATGDIIRFGFYTGISGVGTYFGEAVIVGIASTTQLSIASTAGLNGVSIASTSFKITQSPKYTVIDPNYNSANSSGDTYVYGVDSGGTTGAKSSKYELTHSGWVGVTTYVDQHGNLRVKTETLVAMSGITTGNTPIYDGDPLN